MVVYIPNFNVKRSRMPNFQQKHAQPSRTLGFHHQVTTLLIPLLAALRRSTHARHKADLKCLTLIGGPGGSISSAGVGFRTQNGYSLTKDPPRLRETVTRRTYRKRAAPPRYDSCSISTDLQGIHRMRSRLGNKPERLTALA
jgi:hypothetical protein